MTLVFHVRYQPPNLAISTLYWKAWLLLLVVAAFNPQKIGMADITQFVHFTIHRDHRCVILMLSLMVLGLAAWDGYPTLKMLMEMVMTK